MLHKARCSVREDYQIGKLDYVPYNMYALVASHIAFQILLALAVSKKFLVEEVDVSNAYL